MDGAGREPRAVSVIRTAPRRSPSVVRPDRPFPEGGAKLGEIRDDVDALAIELRREIHRAGATRQQRHRGG